MRNNDDDLYQLLPAEALARLRADTARGLLSDEARERLEQYSANAIAERRVSPLLKFLS